VKVVTGIQLLQKVITDYVNLVTIRNTIAHKVLEEIIYLIGILQKINLCYILMENIYQEQILDIKCLNQVDIKLVMD